MCFQAGPVLSEIELGNEQQHIELPPWIGKFANAD
jgi:CYTH domain-containing protein